MILNQNEETKLIHKEHLQEVLRINRKEDSSLLFKVISKNRLSRRIFLKLIMFLTKYSKYIWLLLIDNSSKYLPSSNIAGKYKSFLNTIVIPGGTLSIERK